MQFNNDNDSVFSDDGSLHSGGAKSGGDSLDLNNDHMAFFKKGNMLQNRQYHQNKFVNQIKDEGTNGFLSQFSDLAYNNPSDPVSVNNTPDIKGKYGNTSKLEMERDLALKGHYSSFENNNDMTYGVVNEQNFVHNNMVPFFKSGIGKGYEQDSKVTQQLNDVKQRKLELFSGSSKSPDYRPKTERRPLFNPQVGLTNIYGMPNFTDYFQSRYIPGKERRNEFISQPVRVTPGLNLGYNEVSKQGFENTWRSLPKTVDELRPANKPKVTYGSRVVDGMKGEKRAVIPNVAKRRPLKFKEQDPKDLLKSFGYITAPVVYGNYDVAATNRQMTSKEWYGPAGLANEQSLPESMIEKSRLPMRENFLSAAPRNTTAIEREKNTSNTGSTYYVAPTNRMTTENNTNLGNLGRGSLDKGYAFDMKTNMPDPTGRNVIEQNTNLGTVGTGALDKGGYGSTQSGIHIGQTLRNVTENNTNLGLIGRGAFDKGGYGPEQSGIHAPATLRNVIENNTNIGLVGTTSLDKGAYGVQQSGIHMPSTLRNVIENNTNLGGIGTTSLDKGGYAATQSNIHVPLTLRNIVENNTNIGGIGNSSLDKGGYGVQRDNIHLNPTIRQTTEKNTNLSLIGTNELNRGGYDILQQNITVPNTLKQLTEKNTNLSMIGTNELNRGGYDVLQQGLHLQNTMRQLTEKNSNLGLVGTGQLNRGGYGVQQSNIVVAPTIRQTTENNTNLGGIGTNVLNRGGYSVTQDGIILPTTLRQLSQNNSNLGVVGTSQLNRGGYGVELSNTVASITRRQTTEKNTSLSVLGTSTLNKGGYSAEQSGINLSPTLRQLSENNTTLGPAGRNETNKGAYSIDAQNIVMPITLRQLMENSGTLGPVGKGETNKGSYQINIQNTHAPITNRQMSENKTYINPIAPNEREQGAYKINIQNTHAPTTIREMTENKTYQGPLMLNDGSKTRIREDANNSLVNVGRERTNIVREGGRPTTSNYDSGPMFDYTMVQLCEPIEINRDVYGTAIGQNPLQRMPTIYNRQPNSLPESNTRIDSYITSNLANNAFINNTQHKSVQY